MMRAVLLATVAFFATTTMAESKVIYTFITTSFGANNGLSGIPLSITYDLSDAVVARGSFVLNGPPGGYNGASHSPFPLTFTGNSGDFTQLLIQGERVAPDYLYGSISTSLSINSVTGDVTSSSLTFNGVMEAVQLSGSGAAASGFVGSDQISCNASLASRNCFVSGNWSHTAIPEPTTTAMVGVALAAFGMARRKRSLALDG